MKCECCHEEEATIHLTQVIDGKVKKLNLCQVCAQNNGIDLNSPISITDVLLGLGAGITSPAVQHSEFDLCCGRCHMTRSEFKKNARLGCPECYQAFMGELNALTKAMHHSEQHVGKIPARQGNRARMTAQITLMQKEIEAAVAQEDYEMAASLRDKITELRSQVSDLPDGVEDDA